MDERRKWHSWTVNDVSMSCSEDHRSFFLQDSKTGGSLLLVRDQDNARIINDESGRMIRIAPGSEITAGQGLTVSNLTSAQEIGLS